MAEVEERELRLAIQRGKYVAVEEVRETWTVKVGRSRALMEARLLNEFPPVLSGLDAHGIRKELEVFLEELYALLHEGEN